MNLIRAVQVLVDAQVDFVIIGGWSAILHGSAHLTRDLDICFSRARDNLNRIAAALRPYHPRLRDLPPDLAFVWNEATLRNGTVFTLVTNLGVIDLLAEVSGVGNSFDREVRTLDLRSLIRAKRAAGRAKDLAILPELESLLEASERE